MAMLKPLGIEKGKAFKPDARQAGLLTEAALVGEAMARANAYLSPTGILEPLRDRHTGARRGSAYWSQGVIAVMEPVADRHIGAR
jgi:hypothetical protein